MSTHAIVDGVRIPYLRTGSGPALLLVHGTGPSADLAFGQLIDRFAGRTLLVPDLSGSEPVADDGGPLTLELLARQLLGVLDDARVDTADVTGFSLGAPAALTVAATAPERIRRTVAVAPWLHAPSDPYLSQFFPLWQGLLELKGDEFGRFSTLTGFSPDFLASIGKPGVRQLAGNLKASPNLRRQIDLGATLDLSAVLPGVPRGGADVRIAAMRQDATIPPPSVARVRQGLPNSDHHELPGGHVVVLEQPDAFVAAVREWIDD